MISEERVVWVHREAIINGIRFHYVEAGEGPLILLLHGFPGFWRCWRHQIPALAVAGFHVIAPDMRGYNLSEKPVGVAAYHIDRLVGDAGAFLQTFGGETGGYLIGHNWGGVIAWYTASRHPELVQKLIVLNAPHPNRYLEVLRTSRSQKLKSYYVAVFQLPWLPEWLFTANRGATVERALRGSGVSAEHFTQEDARAYRQAIIQPGAAQAALNYYRAMVRRTLAQSMRETPVSVQIPTLLLWGRDDVALEVSNADRDALSQWVLDLRVELLEASHWVQIDQPALVSARIIEFLGDGARQ